MRRIALVAVVTGCALTSDAPPLQIRHFSPDIAAHEDTEAREEQRRCGALALGRVDASAHLRYRIARRTSSVELSLYDTLRWTEHPDVYVRRSLAHSLFAGAGLDEVMRSGDAPVLDVEVLAFEQIDSPVVGGRVQLAYRLRDDREILASDIVTVQTPSTNAHITSVVAAIGTATERASEQILRRVVPLVRARSRCKD